MKSEEIACPLGKLLLKFTTLEQPCRPTNPLFTILFWQILFVGGTTRNENTLLQPAQGCVL